MEDEEIGDDSPREDGGREGARDCAGNGGCEEWVGVGVTLGRKNSMT